MNAVVAMAARLNRRLPAMHEGHEAILTLRPVGAGAREAAPLGFRAAGATPDGGCGIEAEVLYPAAIVAGKFLEFQMDSMPSHA
jgi:hypothetical protein